MAAAVLFACNREAAVNTGNESATHHAAIPVNLSAEIERAKTEDKLLFMEFGSSDSCPPCMELQREVFSKPEFLKYAGSNIVFIRLDYPLKSKLAPEVQATNELLSVQFGVWAFPTFVALDHEGKEIWRMPATDDPNPGIPTGLFKPAGFIEMLEGLRKKQ